ncbi:MAG TPA: HWE histidine kinase domain-containing protein [Allosphingosinicella sp.]|nr:HWE histidine kinase domain-containing protein [Allosphingosinicella sp.]
MLHNASPPDPIEALRPVLDTALDAVVLIRADGTVIAWNGAAERTFGFAAGEAVGRNMSQLIVPPQHREAHDSGMRRYLETGEARVLGRRIEITALKKCGAEIPVELSVTQAPSGTGNLFIGFLRDISERRQAEERIRRQAREAELLFQVTRMAADTGSFEDALRSCLQAICEVGEWPVGHALVMAKGSRSELVSTGIWHDAVPGISTSLREATTRIRFTPGVGLPGAALQSGEPTWMGDSEASPNFLRKGLGFGAAFAFPVKSEGKIIAVLEFFTRSAAPPDADLMMTARALGEQVGRVIERKRTEDHQRLLVNELNHRVKNTLAVVQGIAAQTFRGEAAQVEARAAFDSRLAALASAHDVLTAENWEAASLYEIVEKTGLGCGADEKRVRIGGPELLIDPRTAVSLAMALHELCTNAVKYGALSTEGGVVGVSWTISQEEGAQRLTLCWQESGGPPVAPPASRGFGSRMIERALASELGGSARLDFHPDGVRCVVEAALPEASGGSTGAYR